MNIKKELAGYKSKTLQALRNVCLETSDTGVLSENQIPLAITADTLRSSLAKVGIAALIDEATGYQYEREQDALQQLLSLYISEEFLPWIKTFPDEFYVQMCRLRGWDCNSQIKTPYAGKLTNYLVYERLPEGVLDELRRLNPIVKDKGYRQHRFHQKLSKEYGYSHLEKHITAVIAMMRAFDTWDEFNRAFRKSFDVIDDLPEEGQAVLNDSIPTVTV